MKLEPKVPDEEIEVDMSPMIDMVFLLLIFFLVASNIIDEKVQVAIPAANYAKIPEDTTGRVMITIDKDENLYWDTIKEPVSMQDLAAYVQTSVDNNPDVRILIRADGSVKYKVSEEVLQMCGENGAMDMIFAAYEQ
jgi:biopolymer transport protein ExbD